MKILLVVLLLLQGLCTWAQSTRLALSKTAATTDGNWSAAEWADADSAHIRMNDGRVVEVFFKRNDTALFVSYRGPLGSFAAVPQFPEMLIDVNHSRSTSLESDDFWLHVSATDCYAQAAINQFDSCAPDHQGWSAAPNFSTVLLPDTIELEVSFSFIGLDLAQTDTVGVSFLTSNTNNIWSTWPNGAVRSDPSTWGELVFKEPSTASGIREVENPEVTVLLNQGSLYLNAGQQQIQSITIHDLMGRMVWHTKRTGSGEQRHAIPALPDGLYLISTRTENGVRTTKHVIR